MEMERVEPRVPVEYGQLDILHMLVSESVGLGAIHVRPEGVVAHGQGCKDRRCDGLSECAK
jgi:hypothetical protein